MVNWRSNLLNLSLCSSRQVEEGWAEIDIVLAGAGVSIFQPVVLLLAVAAEGFFISFYRRT